MKRNIFTSVVLLMLMCSTCFSQVNTSKIKSKGDSNDISVTQDQTDSVGKNYSEINQQGKKNKIDVKQGKNQAPATKNWLWDIVISRLYLVLGIIVSLIAITGVIFVRKRRSKTP